MLPVHVTTWDDTAGRPGGPGDQVLLVHGTLTWGRAAFAEQRALARHRRLLVVDRRGFGESPDTDRSDYDVDAEDVAALMDRPTHLVGHSYGGVVALLAAARHPEHVRSLALLEPSALAAAADDPTVAAALRANRRYVADARSLSVADFLRSVFGDEPIPEPRDLMLRAARTAMRERPCWEADVPLAALRPHAYPKLVLAGSWEKAPPDYRAGTGDALIAASEIVARRIGGRFHQVPETDHMLHQQRPAEVNRLLLEVWEQAEADATAPASDRAARSAEEPL